MNKIIKKASLLIQNRVNSTFVARCLSTGSKDFASPSTPSSQTQKSNEENLPINFFGSQAATWKAVDSRSGGSGGKEETLWYQPYVISGSVAVFLIYFCYLREENDIDKKLDGSLFDHIKGLEETQLLASYKYNKQNGLDVRELEARLLELGIDVRKL